MAEKSRKSKIFAVALVAFTVSVVAAVITMVTFYKIQYKPMNTTTTPNTTEAPPPSMRLPRSLLPSKYRLLVQVYFYHHIKEEVNTTSPNQTTRFTGNSTVYFQCLQNTSIIYLHSQDLNLSDAQVWDEDSDRELAVVDVQNNDTAPHFLQVRLDETLTEGRNYSLFLAFSGEMSPYLEGLYLSKYEEGTPEFQDDPKVQRFLAATNFEPASARRMFPCFDEPDMRAEFNLTVIHRRGTTVIANEARADSEVRGDWVVTTFNPTPKMSTYLLAFVVSDMPHRETHSKLGVTMRIHARREAVEAGHIEYAKSISGKMSDFFQERFGLGYKMTTIDHVALPDLGPLAMENWGLITYQESALLFEPGVSSLLHKEEIAVTVAHELAHQWFGNLVSIKWWNELWLKESFATYMSFLAVDDVESSFNMRDAFVMNAMLSAFEDDALVSSRPLVVPENEVLTYESMYQMYDSITYNKGAMLLRMLETSMTRGHFLKGVKDYLQTYQFQSTDHHDLWSTLQKHGSSDVPRVSEFMEPWISQSGFPVVTINVSDGATSQRRFLYNDTAESSFLWNIRIHYMSNKEDMVKNLNFNKKGPVTKPEFTAESDGWILANVNCNGYFRVNYNSENWERLFAQLETNPGRIPLMNRAQIIDDVFNLARANLVDLTLALSSTRFLRNETEFLPWNSATHNLRYLVEMFDRSEVFGPVQTYLRDQVETLYEFFSNHTNNSSVPEDHYQQHSQILAVKVACANGLQACVAMATGQYANWMNSNTSTNRIPSNLRSTIYCQAVAAGGVEEWEFAWKTYLKTRDTSEREQLRHALTCTRHIWLLNRLLDYTLDPEKIRLTDAGSTIEDVSQNAAGHALAWNFVRANWEHVSKRGCPISLISTISRRFSTQYELQELERFLGDQLGGANEQALEQTRVNIRWVEKNRDMLLRWFRQANEAPPTRQ